MRHLLVSVFVLLSIACTVQNEETAVNRELNGTWKITCEAISTSSKSETFTLSGSNASFKGNIYQGTTCAGTNTQEITATYTVSYGDAATTPSDAKKINLTLQTETLAPKDTSTADSFNNAALCGYTDWTVNVAKNLLGKTCSSTTYPSAGAVIYSIYKRDGTTLYMGKDSGSYDGSSETLRNQTLGTTGYLKQ